MKSNECIGSEEGREAVIPHVEQWRRRSMYRLYETIQVHRWYGYTIYPADVSGHVVKSINRIRSLKQWDRGFVSHLRHRCLYAFILCLCCSVCS
jgi:hypothetical protein